MKTQLDLTEAERLLLVAYRLQRAKDTLIEADKLIENEFYNAAVNRLYYACYYAAIALLVKNNIVAQTHQGVKQMFSLHFVVTNKIAVRQQENSTANTNRKNPLTFDRQRI